MEHPRTLQWLLKLSGETCLEGPPFILTGRKESVLSGFLSSVPCHPLQPSPVLCSKQQAPVHPQPLHTENLYTRPTSWVSSMLLFRTRVAPLRRTIPSLDDRLGLQPLRRSTPSLTMTLCLYRSATLSSSCAMGT